MTATASPRASWDMARPHPHPSHRQSLKTSTTPLAYSPRIPPSVGQPMPPPNPYLNVRSPATQQDARSSSPSYFGFVVDSNNTVPNSDEAAQMKRNWAQSPGSIRSTAATSPKVLPVESNSEFEAFRRQSETNSFNLNHGGLMNFSLSTSKRATETAQTTSGANSREGRPRSPRSSNRPTARDESTDPMDIDETSQPVDYISAGILGPSNAQQESPADFRSDVHTSPQRNQLSHVDDRHPRLSLPTNRLDPPSPGHFLGSHGHRAATLPVEFNAANPSLIPPGTLAELLKSSSPDVLLLDLRPASKFGGGRIKDAINICLSTMLLKRTSFTADRLAEGLSNQQHREKFDTWRNTAYIVVYDDRSSRIQDAASLVTLLKKFPSDTRKGRTLILQGGFAGFAGKHPELVDRGSTSGPSKISPQELSLNSSDTKSAVAGGCAMPATANAANPFFGNIRQNQDLRAGVGQINVKKPSSLKKPNECRLPKWLRGVVDTADEGKKVSDNFLRIEQTEQNRMQKALSGKVCYGSPSDASQTSVQIAGIEKGSKNRYNNIWPFDHTRVRLQSIGAGGCDYINASHVKAPWSQRRYIATQGPVPATFEDFWKLIWEQDVRVIVMLTAESEGGQLKCHRYWDGSSFGQFKLALRDEHRVHLDGSKKSTRPPPPSRRKTTPLTPRSSSAPNSSSLPEPKNTTGEEEPPYVIVRRFSLRHTAHPFVPMREITQLCYSSWPDFGAPAHPQHLLGLVEQCEKVNRATAVASPSTGASATQRPVLVHCSAGCGRTGTFCTVDSVMEMLKRQRDAMNGKAEVEEWMQHDEIDLVEHTVKAFREQRISMVQNLGQYVLAYETILEWCSGVIEAETASGPKTPKTG